MHWCADETFALLMFLSMVPGLRFLLRRWVTKMKVHMARNHTTCPHEHCHVDGRNNSVPQADCPPKSSAGV